VRGIREGIDLMRRLWKGERVTVDGEFRHVKRVGGHTFYDQVDARRVVCR